MHPRPPAGRPRTRCTPGRSAAQPGRRPGSSPPPQACRPTTDNVQATRPIQAHGAPGTPCAQYGAARASKRAALCCQTISCGPLNAGSWTVGLTRRGCELPHQLAQTRLRPRWRQRRGTPGLLLPGTGAAPAQSHLAGRRPAASVVRAAVRAPEVQQAPGLEIMQPKLWFRFCSCCKFEGTLPHQGVLCEALRSCKHSWGSHQLVCCEGHH